jgi:hypothetical protein
MVELSSVLVLVALLQVKHVICDGPLQTLRMVQDKSFYGRPQGLLHALIHALGTAVVGLPPGMVALVAAIDGAVHYHVDYIKENTVKAGGWTTKDAPFWWALTTDQALHHMTYVVLVWIALKP